MPDDIQEESAAVLTEEKPELGKRQEFFGKQRDFLAEYVKRDLYPENKARGEFLSGMATQLLENESFDELTASLPEDKTLKKIEDNRRQITRGLEFAKKEFDLWKVTQATEGEKLTPEQIILVLKGYVLERLCDNAKQPREAIKKIAELKSLGPEERHQVVEEFLPFVQQVREKAVVAEKEWQKGTFKGEDYPFNMAPEAYLQELDTAMQLEEFWWDQQERRYKYLRQK